MSKKRWIVLSMGLLLVFASLYILLFVPDANASIKDKVCEGVGCPNGSRDCARVDLGVIEYYCYENPPAQ